ncbi:hypothetical protein GALMADRAFT_1131928 [Galerina marginata CBS 339.88]|uniref:Uncharacterized protein n=1 Tax=Galerina marginata (strain CBS 339.88) TaxID=685588 RepID=A0A067S7Y8_GALM3|nr:hypothetical protein GALMADRAFT_1131928 [Galerina marginata CBS 339.88]
MTLAATETCSCLLSILELDSKPEPGSEGERLLIATRSSTCQLALQVLLLSCVMGVLSFSEEHLIVDVLAPAIMAGMQILRYLCLIRVQVGGSARL